MSIESIKKDWEEVSPLIAGCGLNWSYYRGNGGITIRVSDCKSNEIILAFPSMEQAKTCIPTVILRVKELFAMTKQEEDDEEELP